MKARNACFHIARQAARSSEASSRVSRHPPSATHFRASSSSSRNSDQQRPLVQHRHLRGLHRGGFVAYDEAHATQEKLRGDFLRWKTLKDAEREAAGPLWPALITFEAEPTFTLGRRQEDLTEGQAALLTHDLKMKLRRGKGVVDQTLKPVVRRTQRGGLTTYHGPGQLVIWPVLDMHSSLYAPFTVASYAHCLEATTQRLLSTLYGLETITSEENPGVWIPGNNSGSRPARKVAALGVHHRRHVTGLGTAINVDLPTEGDEEGNPWARFEPCGLSREGVTSIAREVKSLHGEAPKAWDLEDLARAWGKLFEEAVRDERMR
ncbi:biotin/lipoate a/B protein ligase family protein [Sarocladium implicatum]|nr:biotin/lipoate a/B protein ligase family protein [Sarocladium implicatum]